MKNIYLALVVFSLTISNVMAQEYVIDKKGMHAFIQFKISHLGYSWLWGRFNDFNGTLTYDKDKPEASKIEVTINTNSVDSNHAERDNHIRGKGLLETNQYPEAKFVSTSFTQNKDNTAVLKGQFTLHGVTKEISIDVKHIGEGNDPWGGYRVGFEGTTKLALADYNITKNLGPASKEVELIFSIEAIQKK
ncbi:MAG: YceI family protein [Gammaproteobacteria bacterium]|nr:YceI family protein [Gammaproteobacteria bacterium]